MDYWQSFQTASGMGEALPWAIICFAACAAILSILYPESRNRVRAALILFFFGMMGLLLAAWAMPATGTGSGFIYRAVRATSVILQAISIVTLGGEVVFDVILKSVRLRPPPILRDLLLAMAYAGAGLFLLAHSGLDLTSIVATSAVVTAVIGFSLQDTLGNVMGGMALQLERTIGPGDWIKVDQTVGIVKEIRWRQTSIETRDWDTVVIPNSVLMKSQVTILGRRDGHSRQHRQTISFNVDFRYAPTEVIVAVQSALRVDAIANVAVTPPPECVLADFKDSYATYSVRYWLIDLDPNDTTDSVIRSRIVFALKRAGIPMSIPAYSNFQTEENDERRRGKLEQDRQQRTEALGGVEIFQPLTDQERSQLAGRLRAAPFAGGEVITRQGDDSPCLFLLTRGQAEVRVAVDGAGMTKHVATLNSGEVFGEMGLLTGDKRSATVVALGDASCYRLDKSAFIDILLRRPEIAGEISHILARRRVELDTARENLSEEARRARLQSTQGDLFQRIRKFFTLDL